MGLGLVAIGGIATGGKSAAVCCRQQVLNLLLVNNEGFRTMMSDSEPYDTTTMGGYVVKWIVLLCLCHPLMPLLLPN